MAAPASTLTPQQQEARKGRITSTRIVKLVNGRQWDVWADMMGLAPPVKDNPRMRFGRKLERAIIEAAAEDKGWASVDYQPGTVTRGDYATSPDAYAAYSFGSACVVEAKNRGAEQARKYDANEPTEDEIIQTAWHMGVTGIPQASVCVLLGGNDLRIFDQRHDDDTWLGLQGVADKFLTDFYKPGKPPPMDASDAAAGYLKSVFPTHRAPMLRADPTAAEWMAELRQACADEDSASERVKTLRHRLCALIGDAEGLECDLGRITYKATKARSSTDWEAIVRDLEATIPADLIAKHTTIKPGPRVFRPTWKES